MDKIIDLDVLRPERVIVKLAGKEMDVSFIPTGCTFDIDEKIAKLRELTVIDANLKEKVGARMPTEEEKAKMRAGQEKAYNLAVEICAVFCQAKYPEMGVEWFRDNTSPEQVNGFVEAIKGTLMKSYSAIEPYVKN